MKLLKYIIGLLLFPLGIGVIYLAQLGAAPWDAFNGIISKITKISVGNVILIEGIFLVISILIINKRKTKQDLINAMGVIGIGIIIGLLLDFYISSILKYIVVNNLFAQIITLFIGILIMCVGLAYYVKYGKINGPIDYFILGVGQKTNQEYGKSKFRIEVILVVITVILSLVGLQKIDTSIINVGTIIGAVTMGPIISKMMEKI